MWHHRCVSERPPILTGERKAAWCGQLNEAVRLASSLPSDDLHDGVLCGRSGRPCATARKLNECMKIERPAQKRNAGQLVRTTLLYGVGPSPLQLLSYAVRGLVLAGAFTVVQDTKSTTYRPGEVFMVAAGRVHSEEVGPEGAQILVGRKY